MTLVLANVNLIDGVRPGVTAGVSVTIEEGRIVEVAARGGPGPAGAQVIDLGGGSRRFSSGDADGAAM